MSVILCEFVSPMIFYWIFQIIKCMQCFRYIDWVFHNQTLSIIYLIILSFIFLVYHMHIIFSFSRLSLLRPDFVNLYTRWFCVILKCRNFLIQCVQLLLKTWSLSWSMSFAKTTKFNGVISSYYQPSELKFAPLRQEFLKKWNINVGSKKSSFSRQEKHFMMRSLDPLIWEIQKIFLRLTKLERKDGIYWQWHPNYP
jgi:hypothetical protein